MQFAHNNIDGISADKSAINLSHYSARHRE